MNGYVDAEWHEAARLFPLMSDRELRELAADIKAHGLRTPIVLLAGKILDGRNRHRACQIAGIEPECDYVTTAEVGDPFVHVASLNLHRRHLDESQRGMVGAKLKAHFTEQAKQNQGTRTDLGRDLPQNSGEGKRAREASRQAAAVVNVSHATIDAAGKVLAKGTPELIDAVERGDVSVSAAAEVARLPKSTQAAITAVGPEAVVAEARAQRAERAAGTPAQQTEIPIAQYAPVPSDDVPGGDMNELVLVTRFAADVMAFVGAARKRIDAIKAVREGRNINTRDNAVTHLVLLGDELRDLLQPEARPGLRVVK